MGVLRSTEYGRPNRPGSVLLTSLTVSCVYKTGHAASSSYKQSTFTVLSHTNIPSLCTLSVRRCYSSSNRVEE
jgi:hypothetical protein